MEQEESIGAVVIDYNSYERTIQFFHDILKASNVCIGCFVIVDNSPSTDNIEKLAEALELQKKSWEKVIDLVEKYCVDISYYGKLSATEIIVLHSKKNLGYAKGNNLGYLVLKQLFKFRYTVFSNNDIFFVDQRLDMKMLVDVFSYEKNIGVVGPAVIGLDGKEQSPCKYLTLYESIWVNYYFSFLVRHSRSVLIANASRGNVNWLIGAFLICENEAFEKVGMFDEHTFLYAEEPILSERLRMNGYEVLYVPEVSIVHEGGYSTGKAGAVNIKNKVKLRRTMIESNIYYYEKYKHYPKWKILLTKMVGELYYQLYALKLLFYNIKYGREKK